MKNCVEVFVEYFKVELPRLEQNYQWKIPEIEGFHLSGQKGYLPNIDRTFALTGSCKNC